MFNPPSSSSQCVAEMITYASLIDFIAFPPVLSEFVLEAVTKDKFLNAQLELEVDLSRVFENGTGRYSTVKN